MYICTHTHASGGGGRGPGDRAGAHRPGAFLEPPVEQVRPAPAHYYDYCYYHCSYYCNDKDDIVITLIMFINYDKEPPVEQVRPAPARLMPLYIVYIYIYIYMICIYIYIYIYIYSTI